MKSLLFLSAHTSVWSHAVIATFFRWCVAFAKKESGCRLSLQLKYSQQQGSENDTVTIDGHSPYESDGTNVVKRHLSNVYFSKSNSAAYKQACFYCYICVVCVYRCTNVLCCPLHHQIKKKRFLIWWVNEVFFCFCFFYLLNKGLDCLPSSF